ncbi:MAG: hypothetical protein KA781_03860 [Aquabacterium sp.]|nr:hypothetical protein [Aquabacterium sp.]
MSQFVELLCDLLATPFPDFSTQVACACCRYPNDHQANTAGSNTKEEK